MPATHLHMTRWVDPVELFWLPVLGPSATLLFWRLQIYLFVAPDGCSVSLDALGRELGLGTSESKHAPLPRAIARLVHFGLAKRLASGQLAVRCTVGPISEQQLSGLDKPLQMVEREVVSRGEREDDRDPPASGPSPTADQRAG
jgi:hypothetical protein